MKKHIYATLTAASAVCLIALTGCATNGGGGNVLGAVDSGLASVEQSAQIGRQAFWARHAQIEIGAAEHLFHQ